MGLGGLVIILFFGYVIFDTVKTIGEKEAENGTERQRSKRDS